MLLPSDTPTSLHGYFAAFVLQLLLVGAAILLSRTLDGRAGSLAIMAVTVANACVVATALLGVRRSGAIIAALAIAVVIFVTGLLVWPSWDVASRTGAF